MKDIPQPIKDAAEKEYPLNNNIEAIENIEQRKLITTFIAGATHPDTEKYYFGEFLNLLLWADNEYSPVVEETTRKGIVNFNKWYKIADVEASDIDADIKTYTLSELLHLYRESLTNKSN